MAEVIYTVIWYRTTPKILYWNSFPCFPESFIDRIKREGEIVDSAPECLLCYCTKRRRSVSAWGLCMGDYRPRTTLSILFKIITGAPRSRMHQITQGGRGSRCKRYSYRKKIFLYAFANAGYIFVSRCTEFYLHADDKRHGFINGRVDFMRSAPRFRKTVPDCKIADRLSRNA